MGVDLTEQPNHVPPCLRVQHVDDVGPVVASVIAVAEQLRRDRVTVGLVVDQAAAEVIASRRSSRAFGSSILSRTRRLSPSIPARAILSRLQVLVEFVDLLMGLHLDARHVIPWAFEMGDDLIELHVKGRGVPVLRVLEDEHHQQGCDADGDVGPIDPEDHQPHHDKQGGDEDRPV
jgi:hypothetical protein